MNRSLKIVLTAATVLAAPIAQASAATTKAVYPSVSSISPKRVAIGGTMTVKGKGFRAGKNRNTVVFQRTGKPAIFVRASDATTTKLVVKIPTKLTDFLATKAGAPKATTFRLRILSARFSKSFTPASLSPVITPKTAASGTGGGSTGTGAGSTTAPGAVAPVGPTCQQVAAGDPDGDKDADGITNAREAQIGTDPCNADSDGDGMVDGYEYQSALDLNSIALPYPGKRPWPNALDPSDGGYDFDGDGLSLSQEYSLWRYAGAIFPRRPVQRRHAEQRRPPVRHQLARRSRSTATATASSPTTSATPTATGCPTWSSTTSQGTRDWWSKMYSRRARLLDLHVQRAERDRSRLRRRRRQRRRRRPGPRRLRRTSRRCSRPAGRPASGCSPYNPCLPNPWSRTCSRYVPFSGAWAPFDGSQQPGDMIPFHVSPTPGTTTANTWNGLGGPQN